MISDSMTKSCGKMNNFKVLSYKGCDVRRMMKILVNDPTLIAGYKYIFLHIGTNNLGNKMNGCFIGIISWAR